MADGAQVGQKRVSSAVESTRGTTPSSAAFTINPVTPGANWKADLNYAQSQILQSNRQPAFNIQGNASCSGTMPMELLAEAGFRQWEESAWSAAFAAVSLASVAGAWNNSGTFTRSSGNFLTDTLANRLQVGDVTFATGSTTNQTTLNGAMSDTTGLSLTLTSATPFTGCTYIKIDSEVMIVVAISSTAVVVTKRGACGTTAAMHSNGAAVLPGRVITSITATTIVTSNTTATEGSLTLSFTTSTKRLIPATTRKILTVEEYFADKAIYRRYMGCEANNANYTMPTSGPIGVSFTGVGTQFALTQSSGSPAPTYAALAGKKPFAGAASGTSITRDGAAFAGCVESLNFGVDNGRVAKYGLDGQFACFVEEAARRTLSLSASIYLVDNSLATLFQAGTRFAMQYVSVSPDGDKRRFNWPELVMTDNVEAESGATIIENVTIGVETDPVELVEFWVDEVLLS